MRTGHYDVGHQGTARGDHDTCLLLRLHAQQGRRYGYYTRYIQLRPAIMLSSARGDHDTRLLLRLHAQQGRRYGYYTRYIQLRPAIMLSSARGDHDTRLLLRLHAQQRRSYACVCGLRCALCTFLVRLIG